MFGYIILWNKFVLLLGVTGRCRLVKMALSYFLLVTRRIYDWVVMHVYEFVLLNGCRSGLSSWLCEDLAAAVMSWFIWSGAGLGWPWLPAPSVVVGSAATWLGLYDRVSWSTMASWCTATRSGRRAAWAVSPYVFPWDTKNGAARAQRQNEPHSWCSPIHFFGILLQSPWSWGWSCFSWGGSSPLQIVLGVDSFDFEPVLYVMGS